MTIIKSRNWQHKLRSSVRHSKPKYSNQHSYETTLLHAGDYILSPVNSNKSSKQCTSLMLSSHTFFWCIYVWLIYDLFIIVIVSFSPAKPSKCTNCVDQQPASYLRCKENPPNIPKLRPTATTPKKLFVLEQLRNENLWGQSQQPLQQQQPMQGTDMVNTVMENMNQATFQQF